MSGSTGQFQEGNINSPLADDGGDRANSTSQIPNDIWYILELDNSTEEEIRGEIDRLEEYAKAVVEGHIDLNYNPERAVEVREALRKHNRVPYYLLLPDTEVEAIAGVYRDLIEEWYYRKFPDPLFSHVAEETIKMLLPRGSERLRYLSSYKDAFEHYINDLYSTWCYSRSGYVGDDAITQLISPTYPSVEIVAVALSEFRYNLVDVLGVFLAPNKIRIYTDPVKMIAKSQGRTQGFAPDKGSDLLEG